MISIIAAMNNERVIGKNNALPWNIPEDLKNFKKLTSGNAIIMGRKTYESIGRPLPNRQNIVVSKTMEPAEGIEVCRSLEAAVTAAKSEEVFVIGGATIYQQALPFTDRMYLSYVDKKVEGDVFFPKFEEAEWDITKTEQFDGFVLKVFERKAGTKEKAF
jgi:dihydrofolate reductase